MNQSINLNLIPDGVKPVAKVSQFDVGRVVTFSLYQGPDVYTPPAGTTLEFRELKSDKHICVYDDAATLSGSTITLTTNQQMTAAAGEALCQFQLKKSGIVLATLNFWLDVQVDPAAEGDISDSELPAIIAEATEQMERAEAAANSAAADAESAADSKEDAETAATSAGTSATAAEDSAEDAEAYAVGTRGGTAVPDDDPAYHNNSKYYSDLASAWAAHPPYVGANGDWYVYDPTTQQFVDTGIDASITMQIQDVTMLSYGSTPTVTNSGTSTDAVFHLGIPRAAGIQSVSKTGSSGLVDTYRMLFQDGYFFDFQVTNGADGGGHVIENPSGQNMPARSGLQFTGGVTVSDDSTNGRTVVELPIEMLGASTLTPGARGLVPAPSAGDENKVLKGDGTWGDADALKETHTVTGNLLSFVTESAQVASNTVITLEPIQAGSGDPSPSNVRAISGYDNIFLTIPSGKNLFDKNHLLPYGINSTTGDIDPNNGLQHTPFISVKPNTSYTISGNTNNVRVFNYSDSEYIDSVLYSDNPSTFTTSSTTTKIIIHSAYFNNIKDTLQLEGGTTATTYEPYNPITDISLTLNDTIYGGTLDVESGELVVDRKTHTIPTITTLYYNQPNQYAYGEDVLLNLPINGTHVDMICDRLLSVRGVDFSIIRVDRSVLYRVPINYTVEEFNSNIAGGVFVYPLATPITYHLTPHQVSLLLGANTVTTNGTSISLTYRDGQIAGLSDLEGVAESVEGLGVSKYSHEEANVLGAKNLNSYPYWEKTNTENGITWTDNGDGTVTCNGTSTSISRFYLHNADNDTKLNLKEGKYILSGCPKGGGANTYRVYIGSISDFGEGVEIKVDKDTALGSMALKIESGVTVSNLTFKPIIRLASDPDDTWVPYAMTNRELTENVSALKNKGSASVVADGTKTYANLLNELYALLDISKIDPKSYLSVKYGSGITVYHMIYRETAIIIFNTPSMTGSKGEVITSYTIASSNSSMKSAYQGSVHDDSTTIPTSGTTFEIYY